MRKLPLLPFLFLVCLPLQAAPPKPPLALSFGATAVTATGIVPFGRAALFSVAREPRYYYSEIVRRTEILVDSDGDGSVIYTIPKGVPRKAIWVVVDLSTGRYAVGPTAGYHNEPTPLGRAVLKHDNNGHLRKLEIPFSEVHFFLARPGEGAWWIAVGKDAELDENKGADYGIRIDLSILRPVGDSPSVPKHYKNGDILVFIDPRWMLYSFLEVSE